MNRSAAKRAEQSLADSVEVLLKYLAIAVAGSGCGFGSGYGLMVRMPTSPWKMAHVAAMAADGKRGERDCRPVQQREGGKRWVDAVGRSCLCAAVRGRWRCGKLGRMMMV